MFWFVCITLTLVVGAMIVAPMLRPPAAVTDDPQVALYKAQLAEVDRDVARDVLSEAEAENARAEIARRLLAASKQATQSNAGPMARTTVIITIAAVAVLTGAVYLSIGAPGYGDLPLKKRIAMGDEARANRPSQAAAEAATPVLPIPNVDPDYLAAVEQLREVVPQQDDLAGWQLLARHEAELRNYRAAAAAQLRVVDHLGTDATTDDLIRLTDMMVAAANGYLSPEAENVTRQILTRNPDSIAGLYYLGALYDQTDRPDRAYQLWRRVIEQDTSGGFHAQMARRFVAQAAARAGVDYTPPAPALAGPTMEQMMAAEDMDPAARSDMIAGMVANLSDRLATQGGTVEEWARLITAHGVLGDKDQARAILAEARSVFGASDAALAVLAEAADRAGLTP